MIKLLITVSLSFGIFQISPGQDLEEKVRFLTENTGTVQGKKKSIRSGVFSKHRAPICGIGKDY